MLTQLASISITTLARTLTGVRAIWLVGAPQATPTVYFANHRSHGDFVLLWTSLPPDLRSLTRPVAAADYWLASPMRRFIGCEVFRAVLIDRTGAADRSDPIAQMAAALDTGDSLILFPEGTRNNPMTHCFRSRADYFIWRAGVRMRGSYRFGSTTLIACCRKVRSCRCRSRAR